MDVHTCARLGWRAALGDGLRGVNDDEIAEIVALSRPARVTPLDVRFIEVRSGLEG